MTVKSRFMCVKIFDITRNIKMQNELSVRHENVDSCRTGPTLEANCFYLVSGAAHICEFMWHRLQ